MHRREGKLIVSATDLVGFLECGHLTQLDRAVAAGLLEKPIRDDPEIELLQRRGFEHEQRYIKQLEAEGRRISRLDGDRERPYEARASDTIQAMRRGDDVIFQATVFDGQWVGHPDFLLRVPGQSALGDYHYEVADTKLAHSTRASALIQICSYVEQIERIQGVTPERVHVVLGGAQVTTESFRTAEMMAYYRHAKARFEEALDEASVGPAVYPIPREASYPDPVEHCAVCRWFVRCRNQWRDDDALPLVAGISRGQRNQLQGLAVDTRRGLATATVEPKLTRVREQARLQVESEDAGSLKFELLQPEVDSEGVLVADRGLSALPPPSVGDLFFDIEADPFAFNEGLEYLFGVWDANGDWSATWALNQTQEKEAFEKVVDLFVGRWERDPQMHIYHYAAYEPSALKRLAGRHATREEELDRLLRGRVFVDLYRVVRQGVRVGAERYSIKNLEPLYGYERQIELRDANSSIVEFELYLEGGDPDGRLLEQIELYNRDDCISTQRLRDWLEARLPGAEVQFKITLPRPSIGEPEPTEQLSDRQRAVADLTARLTATIPTDPANQTDTDRATWLVAHLLDWHRREDKSTWWRYYDLMSKTDDELFDEPEAIGRLEFVDSWPVGGRSRSNIYRYSFPAQEHKVGTGYVDDPQLGTHKSTGEVVAIDDDRGLIDIRRSREWSGSHPRSIVQVNVIDAKAQREALMRLGEWVAERGIDADSTEWRAARDLLLRLPPRVIGHVAGSDLKAEGETGSEAALRLARQLDGTTLAIQGPPGSGKTYSGARMILDLVRGGRRVGITSNSHKVISNLVEAVLDAVPAGETLRVLQRCGDGEGHDHPSVTRVGSNPAFDDALAKGEADVVAGTPWLWAREELHGLIDTLFVDEAGQVSLANVVAMSGCARNVVLLGDPQQLDQPTQGVHPDGAGVSALGHFLGGSEVVAPDRGVFLERTWRMHPLITAFTSELFYEGKLAAVAGLERQRVVGDDWLAGSGLRWVPVEHDGNTNASREEAARVTEIWRALVGRQWVDRSGVAHLIGPHDIVIVSPFNAHRLLIQGLLGAEARVGTVDKFQGQQAPVSIYTMATSRPEDAPRGLSFLYSLNRLNVATSRARTLAIVVASPALLAAVPHSPDQLRMINGLCASVDAARRAGDRGSGLHLHVIGRGRTTLAIR